MKTSEIRKMSKEELNKKLVDIKKELFDLRMKQSTGNLDKPHRIKTVLNELDGSEN